MTDENLPIEEDKTPPPEGRPMRRKTDAPWWRDHRAVMEILALLAIAGAILVALLKGKVELEPAILMLTGSIATLGMAVKRRGT